MSFEYIEKLRINRNSFIEWFYNKETASYRVTAKTYNREIYNKVLDKKYYNIYYNYINERIKYLVGECILNKEYNMILLDGTMYRILDNFHFMCLTRGLIPVDSVEIHSFKDYLFDMVLDTSLYTGEIFSETDLVYHNGVFYNNGNRIKDIGDFKRDGVEYNEYDLLNGITKEQLDYLVWDYFSRDFEHYITSEVKLKIDRWY